MTTKKYNIAMVTDYFFPNIGGIESHIITLSEELYLLGNNIIVVTHKYNGYLGCQKIGNLIVYYLDLPIIASNTTFPTLFSSFIIYKEIFEKHKIDIVHGHQTMSTMCIEVLFHAKFLGYKTVLTDHSVFEFSKFERIICNSILHLISKNVNKAICVSKTAMINTQQRTAINKSDFQVITNGINPSMFYPIKKESNWSIVLIYSCRLVFRKGVDLFVAALPLICKDDRFKIMMIGDGLKREEIEQVIDENELHDKIIFLGEKKYNEIPDLLRKGDIFLIIYNYFF